MEFLIFILLLVMVAFQIYLIKCLKDAKTKEEPKVIVKPREEKLTDEQKKRQEELRKAFENLMNYDYNEALKKKE